MREIMTLQDLFANSGIDFSRTKLVRHNLSNETVANNYGRGYLELYQAIQKKRRFKDCDFLISFLGTEGTNGVYQGCYKILKEVPIDPSLIPLDYDRTGMVDGLSFYETEKLDIFPELINRLVIDWGKGTIGWAHNGRTKKEILEIRPVVSEIDFTSYENVLLSYDSLCAIVKNRTAFRVWEDKLSAVAGVYLITDTKTGKHYVGSASGLDGGIWGRWCEYVHTKHGGNKKLKELMAIDAEYCKNFQYSILEVFPIKKDRQDVLKAEQLYKKKLQSIVFGLNDN